MEEQLHIFLAPALCGVWCSTSHPNHTIPRGQSPSKQWIGAWVGPTTRHNGKQQDLCHYDESNPSPQPVAIQTEIPWLLTWWWTSQQMIHLITYKFRWIGAWLPVTACLSIWVQCRKSQSNTSQYFTSSYEIPFTCMKLQCEQPKPLLLLHKKSVTFVTYQ